MNTETTNDTWHVEAGGQVYETNFAEMTQWIEEGSLLRADRVRKGNLRWIEAGKVPALISVFNAKENGQPVPPVVTTTKLEQSNFIPQQQVSNPALETDGFDQDIVNVQTPNVSASVAEPPVIDATVCTVHSDVPARFVCDTCCNSFCKACPSSYGGNVKICPMCGAMCRSLAGSPQAKFTGRVALVGGSLGFDDVAKAFSHPFKFKVSLVLGAVLYSLVSLGQSASGFGGIFMMSSGIFCFMLANMFTFGILAHVTENFSAGRTDVNFMPSFDDFSIWDDVIQPFFLSLGAYVSAFGPLILLLIVAFFFLLSGPNSATNGLQSDAARSINPDLPYAANAAKQSETIRELLDKQKAAQQKRVEALENGEDNEAAPPANAAVRSQKDEDADFERLNNMIQQNRKAELESAIGKAPNTVKSEQAAMIRQLLGYGLVFVLLGAVFLLWGLFYFPAACTVAGYTQSLGATLNPLVGLDTIRRLGLDYVKLLLVVLVLGMISGVFTMILGMVFSAFDLPGVGNLPVKFVGSIVGFYIWTVFSCVVGMMLYKASDRLQLPS